MVEILSITFSVLFGFLIILLWALTILDLYTAIGIIVGDVTSLFTVLQIMDKRKKDDYVVAMVSRYVIGGDAAALDRFLGVLISRGKIEQHIDPVEEFFVCLKSLAYSDNYEMKRRIAEALPGLYKLDLDETITIADLLRSDWDERWKSDNRRRTIESLCELIQENPEYVKEKIHLIEGDEIFVVLAILEILCELRSEEGAQEIDNCFKILLKEMEEYGLISEFASIHDAWELLQLFSEDIHKAFEKVNEVKGFEPIPFQILIARNLYRFCQKKPSEALLLFKYYLNPELHRYIRRPIAKDRTMDCLISLLTRKRIASSVKDVLFQIFKDDDEIIRITAFDKIDMISEIDHNFANEIAEYILENELSDLLKQRAKKFLETSN